MKTARVLGLWATLFIPYTLLSAPRTNYVVNDDVRVEALRGFFQSIHSPLTALASDFVQAADRNGLDWRLLPSIAMVESTGGLHYKNRNVFGWGNGRIKFPSVRSSIYYVASRLSRSRLYSGKSVLAVLRTYNSVRPEYPERVMRFMRRLPAETPSYAAIPPSAAPQNATIHEAAYHAYHGGHWSAGAPAVPSRRAMPVETPFRAS